MNVRPPWSAFAPAVFALAILFLLPSMLSAQQARLLQEGVIRLEGSDYYLDVDVRGFVPGRFGSILEAGVASGDSWTVQRDIALGRLRIGDAEAPVFVEHTFWYLRDDQTLVLTAEGPDAPGLAPLRFTWIWRAETQGASLDFRVTTVDTVDVRTEMDLLYSGSPVTSLRFINTHSYLTAPPVSPEPLEYGWQQGVEFRGAGMQTTFTVHNPFDGNFVVDNSGLTYHVLRTHEPHGMVMGEAVHSILTPGDTVRHQFQVLPAPLSAFPFLKQRFQALISPHPRAAEGTLSLVGDDIPLRFDWVPMSTSHDPDEPVKSRLVRMLEEYSDFRMSLVTVFDPISEQATVPLDTTDGWYMNPGNLSFVPFDAAEGARCLRMQVAADTSVRVWQRIYLHAGDHVSVRAQLKLPSAPSPGGGIRFQLSDAAHHPVWTSEVFDQAGEWYNVEAMQDSGIAETRFYNLEIVLEHAGGSAFVDAVEVDVEGVSFSVRNPGFETGHTALTYISPNYQWADAVGKMNMARNAPPEYRAFLHRVDTGETLYGWEDRIGLGLHAYHHSAVGDFVGPAVIGLDFTLLDPQIQYWTMRRMLEDAQTLGFSEQSTAYLRTAGIHYQHLTVQEALRNGVRLMDCGYSSTAHSPFRVYGHGGWLFLENTVLWGDDPASSWSELDNTRDILSMGGTAIWGWHPNVGLRGGTSDAAYAWFTGKIEAMAREFPNVTWELVHDIAFRGRAIDRLEHLSTTVLPNVVHIAFSGAVEEGFTLVLYADTDEQIGGPVLVDGQHPVHAIRRGQRVFLVLPDLEDGEHVITVPYTAMQTAPEGVAIPITPEFNVWPVPSNGPVRVRWVDPDLGGTVSVRLYNTLGQTVAGEVWRSHDSRVEGVIDANRLASGIYYLQLRSSGSPTLVRSSRVVLVK